MPAILVADLGARLYRFWQRYRDCFTTRTLDTSPLAHEYLQAHLTQVRARNFPNIGRQLTGGDGQRSSTS